MKWWRCVLAHNLGHNFNSINFIALNENKLRSGIYVPKRNYDICALKKLPNKKMLSWRIFNISPFKKKSLNMFCMLEVIQIDSDSDSVSWE